MISVRVRVEQLPNVSCGNILRSRVDWLVPSVSVKSVRNAGTHDHFPYHVGQSGSQTIMLEEGTGTSQSPNSLMIT